MVVSRATILAFDDSAPSGRPGRIAIVPAVVLSAVTVTVVVSGTAAVVKSVPPNTSGVPPAVSASWKSFVVALTT